jgi:hypothetical protein
MTHDILQSDIELAVRLMEEQRPDAEILKNLAHRGIEAGQAVQLLDELRNGRKVSAGSPFPQVFGPRHRPRTEPPPTEEPVSAPPPAPERHRRHSSRPKAESRPAIKLFWRIFLVLLAVAALVVGGVFYWRYKTSGAVAEESGQPAAPAAKPAKAPAGVAKPIGKGSAASLALELGPDGLRLGGSLVTRDNPLSAVVSVLGAPNRTNLLAATGTTVYAFDQQGVLVYVEPAGKTNSIMLDCDATGGANGTTSAFAGTLKLEDQLIGPDTDAQAFAKLKRLGLSSTKSDGSIWGGHYKTVELVFAYLKSPHRLSLIEIDLE